MPPALLFFLKIALDIQVLLWFHTHFRIIFSIAVKNCTEILIGIALNIWMALSSMDILTMLILLIHEHGMSFHLLVPSSVSFIKVF